MTEDGFSGFTGLTVGVAGLGLIGGSLAGALRQRAGCRVLGLDKNPRTVAAALEGGAIDGEWNDIGEAQMVFVALYPAATAEFIRRHAGEFRKGAVVCDLCGIKGWLYRELSEVLRNGDFAFVGGHPMAGRASWGFESADFTLFDGASMILTPQGQKEAARQVAGLMLAAGFGSVTLTTPEEHDRMIGFTSQLPHVLSSCYVMNPAAEDHKGFSAGSFRDMTRVSRTNVEMWSELFAVNAPALCGHIDDMIENLTRYREAVASGDPEQIAVLLREANRKKDQI